MILYIIIGCIYGYSNYRIMKDHGKKDRFPVWYHVIAGILWPFSMITMLWGIYKKCKGDK